MALDDPADVVVQDIWPGRKTCRTVSSPIESLQRNGHLQIQPMRHRRATALPSHWSICRLQRAKCWQLIGALNTASVGAAARASTSKRGERKRRQLETSLEALELVRAGRGPASWDLQEGMRSTLSVASTERAKSKSLTSASSMASASSNPSSPSPSHPSSIEFFFFRPCHPFRPTLRTFSMMLLCPPKPDDMSTAEV